MVSDEEAKEMAAEAAELRRKVGTMD